MSAKHTIQVTKESVRTLTQEKYVSELAVIGSRPMGDTRKSRGWSFTTRERTMTPDGRKFAALIEFTCRPKRSRTSDSIKAEFDKMAELSIRKALRLGWTVFAVDGEKYAAVGEVKAAAAVEVAPPEESKFAEAIIPEDWRRHFEHIYEREDQIQIVMSAVDAAIKSEWTDRYHCALVGSPAAGKTEVLRGFRSMLGEEAVLEFDATSTTQAGAIRILAGRNPLPRILVVEEIEKVEEDALRYLLGILDHRAEINKTNFRSQIQKKIPLLCLVTVNDHRKFEGMMSGALASRFPNKIFVPRPNRDLLHRILVRDVAAIKGNQAWIDPALDYAEKNGITDPRRVIAICKCGRDALLTGEYQKVLDRTNAIHLTTT